MEERCTAERRLILLGSTGSIGRNTLSVIDSLAGGVQIVGLGAASRWELLLDQAVRYRPRALALTDPAAAAAIAERLRVASLGAPRRGAEPAQVYSGPVYSGPDGLVRLVRGVDAEIVLGAVSGAAGLPAAVAALETGKDLALANKESLVCAGAILTRLARERGRRILPVDSEHSAIFQSLRAGRPEDVRAVILTASGGPFRTLTRQRMARVTPEEALQHPTWRMGAKITIDSATLMNKALEVIEARWFFDLPATKIRVVIHPQSIVHSLVEFVDGSMICQLGPPDMRIPIQYALTYPDRRPLPVRRLDLVEVARLDFEEPDPNRFPSLRMAYEVLDRGGTAAAVFNAANEAAVDLFLKRKIGFLQIFELVETALAAHNVLPEPTLDEILQADRWARDEVNRVLT